MAISIEVVIGAIVKMGVEGVWKDAKRREAILHILRKLGLDLNEPPPDFDGLYAYTLVEYGVGKPKQVLGLFRYKPIKEAFRRKFEQRSRVIFDNEIEAFLDSELGQEAYQLDYNPKQELNRFQAVFDKLADRARTVPEVKQDQKLEDIHQVAQQSLHSLDGLSAELSAQRALLEVEQHETDRGVKGAALILRIAVRGKSRPALRNGWVRLLLDVAITSNNEISSENGALKLKVAWPVVFSNSTKIVFRAAHFEMSTGLQLEGYDAAPHAQSMMFRWGDSLGIVIFPGDWYNFYGNPVAVDVPDPSLLPNPTYLVQAEVFTVNSQTKKTLYSIQRNANGDFEIYEVDAANYHSLTASFWATYHSARERLKG